MEYVIGQSPITNLQISNLYIVKESTMSQIPDNGANKSAAVTSLLKAMEWRCIGPPRGGRVVTVTADPVHPTTFYFGACAGGVWKTTDAGQTWQNISDGFFKTASVGALAVAPSDPNVIYAGMGEATIRLDVSYGNGVYKSTDAGQSWTHVGLADTRHIGKVRVHPHNPDIVYVAALGHAFGPNEERGVFRSTDGGQSWQKVLYKSENAGAIDLTLDPRNPRILYASIWQARRSFWNLSSGGPDSGLWRSTDGGDTWTELTGKPGLPKGIKGKIGIAASPMQTGRIWAIVEAEKGGFYRSDDGGESWKLLTDNPDLRYRPWYFSHIIAHPQDPETVYVLNLNVWKSADGGQNFVQVPTPHGDNHDLWIDPQNPQRMIEGNDGGACISYNGGETWSTVYNQLTAQFYRIDVDNQFPYYVYGTQQDNSSISVPSRTNHGAITWADCRVAGTGESGFIAAHPEKPHIGYVGAVGSSPGGGAAIQRYNLHTRQIQLVNVWPEEDIGYGSKDLKYRFPWTFPILFSPHDANVLYTAGNIVFKTTDEGHSWQPISPDLTRADMSKLEPSGGPITKDTTGAEDYATISALVESPLAPGLFWAGSDDGLIHISKDGGQSWQNITPPDLPEWSYIHTIEQSPHQAATAYVAATRYKIDDFQPYLYKTEDYGQTWQKITHGIPADDFTRVIRADPHRPGLLYAGTETGLYISFDDGEQWQRWASNLPVAPIYDMRIKEHDLVVGTHGRSFWILDDLTPLYQLAGDEASGSKLFKPNAATRQLPDLTASWFEGEGKEYHVGLGAPTIYSRTKTELGLTRRSFWDAGQSAPDGVIVYYYLPQKPAEGADISLTFLDEAGHVIRQFTTKPPEEDEDKKKNGPDAEIEDKGPWIPAEAGVNRFVWNLRYAGARKVPGDKTVSPTDRRGPLVTPGVYRAQLKVGEQTLTETFEVLKDPRVSTGQADLEAQLKLLLKIRDKLSQTHDTVNAIRDVRKQVEAWEHRLKNQPQPKIAEAAAALKEKLRLLEDKLIVPDNKYNQARLFDFPARLNMKLAGLVSVVGSADAAPTRQAQEVFNLVAGQIDEQIGNWHEVLDTDVAAFNALVRQVDLPAIAPPV
jgi:photosystem II stability/assembly factor-like uncharacterized protein